MRKLALVSAYFLLSGVLLSAQDKPTEPAVSESQQQDWALLWKAHNTSVALALKALKKTDEYKDYEAAVKAQETTQKVIAAKTPKGFAFDTATGKVVPAPPVEQKK